MEITFVRFRFLNNNNCDKNDKMIFYCSTVGTRLTTIPPFDSMKINKIIHLMLGITVDPVSCFPLTKFRSVVRQMEHVCVYRYYESLDVRRIGVAKSETKNRFLRSNSNVIDKIVHATAKIQSFHFFCFVLFLLLLLRLPLATVLCFLHFVICLCSRTHTNRAHSSPHRHQRHEKENTLFSPNIIIYRLSRSRIVNASERFVTATLRVALPLAAHCHYNVNNAKYLRPVRVDCMRTKCFVFSLF